MDELPFYGRAYGRTYRPVGERVCRLLRRNLAFMQVLEVDLGGCGGCQSGCMVLDRGHCRA